MTFIILEASDGGALNAIHEDNSIAIRPFQGLRGINEDMPVCLKHDLNFRKELAVLIFKFLK